LRVVSLLAGGACCSSALAPEKPTASNVPEADTDIAPIAIGAMPEDDMLAIGKGGSGSSGNGAPSPKRGMPLLPC
jgi:hypothetical protein